jgi:tight adherence protein B
VAAGKELEMLLTIVAITFFMTSVIILAVWLLYSTQTTQDVVRGRIEHLRTAERWAGIATDLKLVRDEVFSSVPVLHRLLGQTTGAVWAQKYIAQAGMKTKPAKILLTSIVIGAFTYTIAGVFVPFLIAVLAGIALAMIPPAVVAWKRYRRLSRFQELFPDALDMIGRAVRAGHAFASALEMVVKESPEPIAGEFSIAFEEQNYGIPMRDALLHLADRVPTVDVRFLVTALIVQKDSGGNLAEILDQLSRVIRERFRILRDVKTKTALGRMTAGILMSLPIAMLIMMMFVNPEYENVLFTDPWGPWVLAIAATMQVVGGLILWRIVTIEV